MNENLGISENEEMNIDSKKPWDTSESLRIIGDSLSQLCAPSLYGGLFENKTPMTELTGQLILDVLKQILQKL